MNKMRFESPDITAENIDKLADLFLNVITESRDEISFGTLRQDSF